MTSFIKSFMLNVLRVTYQFYKFESDTWMRYYYSIFAGCMIILFYFWSIFIIISEKYNIEFLKLDTFKYGLFSLTCLGVTEYYFFKNRKYYEKLLKAYNLINSRNLVIVILFIIFSFISFFYSLYIGKIYRMG